MQPYRLTYNDSNGLRRDTTFWTNNREEAAQKQDEILQREETKCSELFEGQEIDPKSNASVEMGWLENRLKLEGKQLDEFARYSFSFVRSTFGHKGEI